jgi:cell division septum initiation protein DivIVA
MDLAGQLVQLEEIVRDAKSMPLSSSALVNREEVLELLREMQESLPEEIKQARWIVKDREELLAKARADAEKIVEGAREEQLRMSRKEAIVGRANEEAERVLAEAAEESRTLRGEAEDYADTKLAQLEIGLRRLLEDTQAAVRALTKTLDQVEVGRDRLRAPATAAEQEFAPPEKEAQAQFYDEEEQR